MNQQTDQSTEQAPQTAITPPEVTSLGSQEAVVASIGEIFNDPAAAQISTESIPPVVPIKEAIPQADPKAETPPVPSTEVNSNSAQIETSVEQALTPPTTVETSADNLLTNPLEPVIEEEAPPLHDPATVARLHQDIQRMIQEHQYSGAEQEVTRKRIENTRKV